MEDREEGLNAVGREVTSVLDAYVRRIFGRSQKGAHSYDHTLRVLSVSLQIGKEVGANMRILYAAALLHDIGRPREEKTGVTHALLSGEMSKRVLSKAGYTPQETESVVAAIRTHRFSEGLRPVSLEGEILSDADKLDAIGAIGIFRAVAEAAATGGGMEAFLRHADEKLLKLAGLMYTEAGRRLAVSRHRVLEDFIRRLRADMDSAIQ